MEQFLGCIGGTVAVVVGIVAAILARGYALSVIWGWYIAPLFKMDNISIVNAIGLSIIFGMLTGNGKSGQDESLKGKSNRYKLAYGILVGVFAPLMTLAFAWLVYQFK